MNVAIPATVLSPRQNAQGEIDKKRRRNRKKKPSEGTPVSNLQQSPSASTPQKNTGTLRPGQTIKFD